MFKCWNTLGCLDQYMCRGLRLWNRQDRDAVYVVKYMQRMETLEQSGPWSGWGKLSPHGYYVLSLVYVFTLVAKSSIHKIWTFKLNLTTYININQPPKQ